MINLEFNYINFSINIFIQGEEFDTI